MTLAQKRERVRALAAAGKVHLSNTQIAKLTPGTISIILSKHKNFDFDDTQSNAVTAKHGDPSEHLDSVSEALLAECEAEPIANKKSDLPAGVDTMPEEVETFMKQSQEEKLKQHILGETGSTTEQVEDDAESSEHPLQNDAEPEAEDDDSEFKDESLLSIIEMGVTAMQGIGEPVEENDHMSFHLAVDEKLELPNLRDDLRDVTREVEDLQSAWVLNQVSNEKTLTELKGAVGLLEAQIPQLEAKLDVTEITLASLEQQVKELAEKGVGGEVKIVYPDKTVIVGSDSDGHVHFQFKNVAQILASRTHDGFPIPVWLWGAAGGGKTTLGKQLAKAFDVDFYQVSMGPSYTEHKLVGYVNQLSDKYVEGFIRPAFEHGGLVLLDEADLTDAAVLAALNAALANDTYLFPDGKTVKRHENFYVVAGANTLGTGEQGGYRRNKLDAATLDRFIPYHLQYDKRLEESLAGDYPEFAEWIWRVRDFLEETETPGVLGTRAIVYGSSLLRSEIPINDVKRYVLQRFPADVVETILTDFK